MTDEQKPTDAFFDHLGKAGGPTGFGRWLVRRSARRIFAFADIGPGSRVLEIGPGRGDFAELCLAQKVDYYAVEPNPQMAASLTDRGGSVVCARVPPLPAFDMKFDRVVMVNVMEHMSSMEQALETACQIRRVLKPHGRLVIHSPDYLSWRLHFFNCDFSHNYVTTRRRLNQLLVNAGYEEIEGAYLSGPLRGLACIVVSAVASHLPFGLLAALFPGSGLLGKLYKLQLTFSRRVLIRGHNPI